MPRSIWSFSEKQLAKDVSVVTTGIIYRFCLNRTFGRVSSVVSGAQAIARGLPTARPANVIGATAHVLSRDRKMLRRPFVRFCVIESYTR